MAFLAVYRLYLYLQFLSPFRSLPTPAVHRQHISAAYTSCNVQEQCPIIVEQALRMAKSMDTENEAPGRVYLWSILNRAALAISTGKKVLEWFPFGISLGTCVKALMCCALPEFIQMMVQPEGNIFSDDERVQQSVGFLLTGSATPTFTMQCALFVRNEVRPFLPSPTVTRHDEWSRNFLKRLDNGLPSLQAFCNEVFRCDPALSLTGREACCDTTLADVYIPKGTLVMLSPTVANQNPEWWGPDAADFNPARWLNGDGSCRPRSCIGQEIGRLEVKIMVAIMVGQFEMQLADEQKGTCDDVVVRLRELHGW
ncbi:cytochrome P450 [Aspergillus pseudotamarii]|uniref:Cytochrome P450 n=1 Tax=Aspergillus pseudotamarii TaxID=132259 RepID=A0A5N6SP32_ASPPS|nr:cytochrome P450 [Aspergillus pseudotamarii]KAE8135113.1 cytochrome P450 [Aspergillus pseudotamarii]